MLGDESDNNDISKISCDACKKSRVKCDRREPVCFNCSRSGKKCHYSLVLKWGGRPYKKPKLEKLNLVANITTEQFAKNWKEAPSLSSKVRFVDPSKRTRKKRSNNCQKNESTKQGNEQALAVKIDCLPDPSDPWLLDVARHAKLSTCMEFQSPSLLRGGVPRSMSPLPGLLLNVPSFYEAFSIYCNTTSIYFTVADPTLYTSNPMRLLLPCAGMTDDGMLAVVIAFGLAHKSKITHKPMEHRAIKQLLYRAFNNFTMKPSTETPLPLAIMLSSFACISLYRKEALPSINDTRRILINAGYATPFEKLLSISRNNGGECDPKDPKVRLLYCLLRWFAYADTMSSLLTKLEPSDDMVDEYIVRKSQMTHNTKNMGLKDFDSILESIPLNYFDNQIDYNYTKECELTFGKDESSNGIDFLLGFSPKLLAVFVKLIKLIWFNNLLKKVHDRTQALHSNKVEYHPDALILYCTLELENEFKVLAGESPLTDNQGEADSFSSLVASNHCFSTMGLIFLYRRVLAIPQNSRIIQQLCNTILQLVLRFLEPTTKLYAIGVVLPLFVAGCECTDTSLRIQYIESMHGLSLQGFPSLKVMQKCWETGECWYNTDNYEDVMAILGSTEVKPK